MNIKQNAALVDVHPARMPATGVFSNAEKAANRSGRALSSIELLATIEEQNGQFTV